MPDDARAFDNHTFERAAKTPFEIDMRFRIDAIKVILVALDCAADVANERRWVANLLSQDLRCFFCGALRHLFKMCLGVHKPTRRLLAEDFPRRDAFDFV